MTAEDVLDKLEEYITETQSGDVEGDILSWIKEQRKNVSDKKLWHNPKEKPKIPSRIVTAYGMIIDTWDYIGSKYSNTMLKCCHKWAYYEELMNYE